MFALVEKHGTSWKIVATELGTNRSELMVRNLWYARQRKEAKVNGRLASSQSGEGSDSGGMDAVGLNTSALGGLGSELEGAALSMGGGGEDGAHANKGRKRKAADSVDAADGGSGARAPRNSRKSKSGSTPALNLGPPDLSSGLAGLQMPALTGGMPMAGLIGLNELQVVGGLGGSSSGALSGNLLGLGLAPISEPLAALQLPPALPALPTGSILGSATTSADAAATSDVPAVDSKKGASKRARKDSAPSAVDAGLNNKSPGEQPPLAAPASVQLSNFGNLLAPLPGAPIGHGSPLGVGGSGVGISPLTVLNLGGSAGLSMGLSAHGLNSFMGLPSTAGNLSSQAVSASARRGSSSSPLPGPSFGTGSGLSAGPPPNLMPHISPLDHGAAAHFSLAAQLPEPGGSAGDNLGLMTMRGGSGSDSKGKARNSASGKGGVLEQALGHHDTLVTASAQTS